MSTVTKGDTIKSVKNSPFFQKGSSTRPFAIRTQFGALASIFELN